MLLSKLPKISIYQYMDFLALSWTTTYLSFCPSFSAFPHLGKSLLQLCLELPPSNLPARFLINCFCCPKLVRNFSFHSLCGQKMISVRQRYKMILSDRIIERYVLHYRIKHALWLQGCGVLLFNLFMFTVMWTIRTLPHFYSQWLVSLDGQKFKLHFIYYIPIFYIYNYYCYFINICTCLYMHICVYLYIYRCVYMRVCVFLICSM